MDEVRWGIIGCGDVCEVKSGPALYKTTKSKLVAVMRRNGELAKDYAERHRVPIWYDDAQKLVEDPDVNMVYVATPPSSHRAYSLAAAKAGKPVYVEKPMAMNHDECQEMIAACEDAGVPLFVAYYRRGQPRFRKVKELIDAHAIGGPRLVNVRLNTKVNERDKNPETRQWRVIPEIAGGGIFCDLACHTLDVLQFFFGPIRTALGFATNQGGFYAAEDTVTGTFQFEDGTHGTGAWSFVTGDRQDVIEIIGTEGKIVLSTFGFEPIKLINQEGEKEFDIEKPEHAHQPLVETIVSELTGGDRKCPSTGITGARTNWVMDEMLKSYRETGPKLSDS
jgi:predicted dehydrogenase